MKSRRRVNSTVLPKQDTFRTFRTRPCVIAVLWFITLPCLTPLSISRAQSYDRTPPPLGRLIDIGSRRLHLYCVGNGSPAVIIENGQSSFSIDWGLVQPEVAEVTRVCTYDRAPPTQIEEPYDRLQQNLQSLRLWASQKFFAEMDVINDLITADSWRSEFIALRRRRLASPHPLGNLPLIVLGRNQEDNATRQRDLRALTALSNVGRLIITENSGHAIHLYRPELVTRSN